MGRLRPRTVRLLGRLRPRTDRLLGRLHTGRNVYLSKLLAWTDLLRRTNFTIGGALLEEGSCLFLLLPNGSLTWQRRRRTKRTVKAV